MFLWVSKRVSMQWSMVLGVKADGRLVRVEARRSSSLTMSLLTQNKTKNVRPWQKDVLIFWWSKICVYFKSKLQVHLKGKATNNKKSALRELRKTFLINSVVMSATELDTQTGTVLLITAPQMVTSLRYPPMSGCICLRFGVSVVNSDVKICSDRHIPTNCAPIRAGIISRDHL